MGTSRPRKAADKRKKIGAGIGHLTVYRVTKPDGGTYLEYVFQMQDDPRFEVELAAAKKK